MFETLLARGEHLAEVQAQRAVLRFLNGVDWLIRDPAALTGRTPFDVVYARGKLQVRRYRPVVTSRTRLTQFRRRLRAWRASVTCRFRRGLAPERTAIAVRPIDSTTIHQLRAAGEDRDASASPLLGPSHRGSRRPVGCR